MGIVENYTLGRTIKGQMSLTTPAQFGDPAQAAFLAAESFRTLEGYTLEVAEAREPILDSSANRSIRQRLRRKTTTNLSFATYIRLMGANGTPEMREALIAAFGAEGVVSTTTTYSLTNVLSAMNILYENGQAVGEAVYGWVCESLRIGLPNGDEPRFEFTGPAKVSAHVASSAVQGLIDGSGTPVGTVTLSTPLDAGAFEVGGLIMFSGSVADDLAQHRVTAVDTGAGTVAFTPNITTNLGTTRVIPYTSYDETQFPNAGTTPPAFTGDSAVTINGSTVEYLEAEITLANQYDTIDPAGTRTPTDFCVGRRLVTGNITLYGSESSMIRRILANNAIDVTTGASFAALNFALGRGLSGDPRVRIEMPRVQFDRGALDNSEPGPSTFQLPFQALGPADFSVADNEISLIFDVVP